MTKYAVLGGFLGAGKTSLMIAFSKYLYDEKGVKTALLVNDLGSKDLVDGSFTALSGCVCDTVTGDCICYQTETLVDKLRRLRDEKKAEMIFSDIPGCGIGALEHVYHKLDKLCRGEFTLCPFVAVCDPERLTAIMPGKKDIGLPPEMNFLFDAQLREAEVILLNKTDLISEAEKNACLSFLRETYPHRKIFAVSTRTGDGVNEAADYIIAHTSELRSEDIGYGGAEFTAAEATLSWYDRIMYLKSETPFDGNGLIGDYIEEIKKLLAAAGRNVPHLKVYAVNERNEAAKASLVGIAHFAEFDREFADRCSALRITVNARAACESEMLDKIMDDALLRTATRFAMSRHIFFTECFGMMDEGRR